ncbi:MAG: hypothetical protein KIT56_11205 [Gammaproteobacteria bacterium]|nr:hypothetical protein [Gammaproteobacteria bacterium]MCW5584413.1 hypothetical protein [Gammaproteobacteria bacterium]
MSDTRRNKALEEFLQPFKEMEREISLKRNFRNDFEQILIKLKHNDANLIAIDFTDKYINHDDIVALAEALKNNHMVTYLNLTNNKINSNGAKVLAEMLKRNKVLELIILDKNNIGRSGVKEILNAVRHDRTRLLHVQLLNQRSTKKEQNYHEKMNRAFSGRGFYSYESALRAIERAKSIESEIGKKLAELRKKKSKVTLEGLHNAQKTNDYFTCDIDTTLIHPMDVTEKLIQFKEENSKREKIREIQKWALPLIAFMQTFKQYDTDIQKKCYAGQLPYELILKIISFIHPKHPSINMSSMYRLFSVVQKHRPNKITSDCGYSLNPSKNSFA